jgi:hypothetical protein
MPFNNSVGGEILAPTKSEFWADLFCLFQSNLHERPDFKISRIRLVDIHGICEPLVPVAEF